MCCAVIYCAVLCCDEILLQSDWEEFHDTFIQLSFSFLLRFALPHFTTLHHTKSQYSNEIFFIG